MDQAHKRAFRNLKLQAIEQIMENHSQLIYHNLDFAKRIADNARTIGAAEEISEDKIEQVCAAAWLYTQLFGVFNQREKSVSTYEKEFAVFVRQHSAEIIKDAGYNEQLVTQIQDILMGALLKEDQSDSFLANVFKDALIMDFIGKSRKDRLEKFYKEAILNDVEISLKKFYKIIISILMDYQSKTNYGRLHVQPRIAELILTLEKEQSRVDRQNEVILKKEFDINESELKELRKNLRSINGRDSRGIQTLFRTTSNNHYTLNEMVDKKANIMITVNSIILSILIGGLFSGQAQTYPMVSAAIMVLSFASFVSIIFAIIAITPNKTQGRFTLEDIKNKNGNLLYYGNFHNMTFKDYEWGMLQKLNDSDFLYSSMIKDIYFLGQSLNKKYKFIRFSLGFFLAGLISSFVISIVSTVWP